jgi:hypothetical protein
MIRNYLFALGSRIGSLFKNYQIGKYYWWNWIVVIHGFIESTVLYWLYRVLRPDHWATEQSFDEMARSAETLFVMGSGASVNEITDEQWQHIEDVGDVMSFNYFFRGEFVPVDYHLAREVEAPPAPWNMSMLTRHRKFREYFGGLTSNPCYDSCTFFILQQPVRWRDRASASMIWGIYIWKYLAGRDITFFQNGTGDLPREHIDDISHVGGTLTDAINIGYLMGYDEIVLVGVDLYNRKYFWFDSEDEVRETDEERGADADDEHRTAPTMVRVMDEWQTFLAEHGVTLSVENGNSLLHTDGTVPVYKYPS